MAPNQRFSASGRRARPAVPNPSASSAASARATALALAARRDYTSAELEARLTDRGYDAAAIVGAIADLTAGGVIDDRRVAAAHVRTARAIKGRGRIRIARELAARGISRDLIDDALGTVAPEDELTSIRRILTRKRWPAQPSRAERQRMYRHLLGRGFPADAISKALGRHGADEDLEE